MRILSSTQRNRVTSLLVSLSLLLPLAFAPRSSAQANINEKDVEQRLKTLHGDAKKFRSMFDSALAKTDFHKTGQESDAKLLAENLQNMTKNLEDGFKQTKKPDPYLQSCLDTASKIDGVFKSVQLDSDTMAQWHRVQSELNAIDKLFRASGS